MPSSKLVITMALFPLLALSQPEGWKMTDRFTGFRYEMKGRVRGVGMRRAIQEKANELACFGWTQHSNSNSVVGEVRCNKRSGEKMKEWMRSIEHHPEKSFVEHVEIKDYDDTKIKLHFSHFKILEDGRETCFRDPPHQCEEFVEKERKEKKSEGLLHGVASESEL